MMVIRGVGIDIVSMSRFEKVYAKHGQRLIAEFFAE